MLHKFFGGVRLAGRKGATRAVATQPMQTPPERVFLPVREPLVAVGDRVEVGTRLCHGGCGVHASVSGTVEELDHYRQTDGRETLCAVIKNDGLNTPAKAGERAIAELSPFAVAESDIIAAVDWAGVGGLGGGESLTTAEKLRGARGKVDVLILNGCECESYLTADHRLLLERTADVLTGARLLARAVGLTGVVIAVAGDKYDAVTALRALLPLRGGDVELKVLRTRYPQGGEAQLTRIITGRRVPPGGRPQDVGAVVFSAATAAAVCDAVYEGRPMTHRIVTVTGSAIAQPKNLLVPLGTPLADLIAEAGGFTKPPERVLAGGGMMGITQKNLAAPVTPGVGGVVAMKKAEVKTATRAATQCLRCGRCVDVCPEKLEPVTLRLLASAHRWHEVTALGIERCTECGACAYACPARIRLTGDIRATKEYLRENREVRGVE